MIKFKKRKVIVPGEREQMSFKEFYNWCGYIACVGFWDFRTAISCSSLIVAINKLPKLKQEKTWRKEYMKLVLDNIVNPIEKRIEKIMKEEDS